MRNFRKWDVWLNGRMFLKDAYVLTANFPETEKFGLLSQLRRASVSIPANISEGAGRKTEKDFASYLYTVSEFDILCLTFIKP